MGGVVVGGGCAEGAGLWGCAERAWVRSWTGRGSERARFRGGVGYVGAVRGGRSRGGYRLITFSSVRLFLALPSGVLLSATGWVSPQPLEDRRAGAIPLVMR